MIKRHLVFLFAALVVSACVPLLAPPAAPTLAPGALNTIVAQTAGAAATQTALVPPPTSTLIPTPTLLITTTATEIPSLTPTFVFVLVTATRPRPTATDSDEAADEYACEVLSQMPEDNVAYSPNTDFDVRWQVKNTGTKDWEADSTDYRFQTGAVLHKNSIYDLYKTVPVGGIADIIVDMRAPSDPDTYSTTWYLRVGKTGFCSMRLTIVVR